MSNDQCRTECSLVDVSHEYDIPAPFEVFECAECGTVFKHDREYNTVTELNQ